VARIFYRREGGKDKRDSARRLDPIVIDRAKEGG